MQTQKEIQRSLAVLKNDVVAVAIMLQNHPEQGKLKNMKIKRKFKGLTEWSKKESKWIFVTYMYHRQVYI